MKMKLRNNIYAMTSDKLIYKVVSFEELWSDELVMDVKMELVAGHDYIDPDWSDQQGYVSHENFTGQIQSDSFTWFPLDETIEGRLADENYKVIDINDYTIHKSTLVKAEME
jgi:hypothetical protein